MALRIGISGGAHAPAPAATANAKTQMPLCNRLFMISSAKLDVSGSVRGYILRLSALSGQPARRQLAARAIITASPGHLNPPDQRAAPITTFAFPPVSAMPPLIFSRLSGRVHKVRYGGTPQPDRAFQDFPQCAAQAFRLTMRELRATPRRVDLCPPQAFIRIDVSHAAQNVLIKQQSL